jgi:hypothetical protein
VAARAFMMTRSSVVAVLALMIVLWDAGLIRAAEVEVRCGAAATRAGPRSYAGIGGQSPGLNTIVASIRSCSFPCRTVSGLWQFREADQHGTGVLCDADRWAYGLTVRADRFLVVAPIEKPDPGLVMRPLAQ